MGEIMATKKKSAKKTVKKKTSKHVVHRLKKKVEKISKHIKKMKSDVQSSFRLEQIKRKLRGY
jgi:ribosomal protein S15P/S13E